MRHTPGPWNLETVETSLGTCHKIGPFPSLGVYPQTHACMYADNVRLTDYGNSAVGDELLANARLIAAAPELLEALQTLLDESECYCLDAQERAGRGVCGHCQGKAVLAKVSA